MSFTLTHQQSMECTHSKVFPQRGQVLVIVELLIVELLNCCLFFRKFGRISHPPELSWGFAIPEKNINYLNNIALGMSPAWNEASRTPSLE